MIRRCHSSLDLSAARRFIVLALVVFLYPVSGQDKFGTQPDGSIFLPNGQIITPAGTQIPLNSLPMAAELSRDGRYLLTLQSGYETPSLSVIDIKARKTIQQLELPGAWLGLTLNRAGNKLYVSGGARSSVWELSFRNGVLDILNEFSLPVKCEDICPVLIGDLLLDPDDRQLYALDLLGNRAIIINIQSGFILNQFPTGASPYRMDLTPDESHFLISHWGEAAVGLYRKADFRLVDRIFVGQHPADLLIVPGEVTFIGRGISDETERSYMTRMFVACPHSDNVYSYGITEQNQFDLLGAMPVSPLPGSSIGSLPTALAVSQDNSELYVANSGDNSILVCDIQEALPEIKGVFPVGWFPTAVVGMNDGEIAYLSGKGNGINAGLAGLLPTLTEEQLRMLSSRAVENLPSFQVQHRAVPDTVSHVFLVLADGQVESWQELRKTFVDLPRYTQPARNELNQLAWITSGMETDFFAKLGPAVSAGRLSMKDIATGGRAALPAAGTIWSNALDAGVPAETYGIGGGKPISSLLNRLGSVESTLARLNVVKLRGLPQDQDKDLAAFMRAIRQHPDYETTAIFVLPVGEADGAVLAGGLAVKQSENPRLVTAPMVLHTSEWLLGLSPMTQFDRTAPILEDLFITGASSRP